MTRIILTTALCLLLAATAQAQEVFQDPNGKFGYKDSSGKVLVEAKYDMARAFSEGFAAVGIISISGFDENGLEIWISKYGFINKAGKEITPIKYTLVEDFKKDGFACVNVGGVTDANGSTKGGWGFIDSTGKEIIPPKYDYVFFYGSPETFFSNGPVRVNIGGTLDTWIIIGGKWGFVDITGKEVMPMTNKYYMVWDFKEGLAKVVVGGHSIGDDVVDGKYGFIDRTGKEIVPPIYDYIQDFYNGFAAVNRDKKWGLIDSTGNLVIAPKYDSVEGFEDGKAKVQLNGETFYIDKNGNEIRQ